MNNRPLEDVLARIQQLELREQFDLVVAIGSGGVIPAALLNQRLKLPLEILWINRRDESNAIVHDTPALIKSLSFDCRGKRILLVDDRNKTGTTLAFARSLLTDAALVRTFVINGEADYALYNEPCFRFPWKL